MYDVFISYKSDHRKWVTESFLDVLKLSVSEELGRNANIFLDCGDIRKGANWKHALQRALASSRVLVPLWSNLYFSSYWCTYELAYMLARQERCGYASLEHEWFLVIPAKIYPKVRVPDCVSNIQSINLEAVVGNYIHKNSPKMERLEDLVREWAPDIAGAIRSAPDHDSEWLSWNENSPQINEIIRKISLERCTNPGLPSLAS